MTHSAEYQVLSAEDFGTHHSLLSTDLDYMSTTGSPAKIVWQWRFLNQQIKNGSFSSDYGVHASVLRKPEIIAKHPPAWSRFNNPVTRWCGGALFVCASPRLRVDAS
jgi:hypothetical protein